MTEQLQPASPSVEPLDIVAGEKDEELRRLGIIAREHIVYEWNGYRYSSARDAIAAARRASQ